MEADAWRAFPAECEAKVVVINPRCSQLLDLLEIINKAKEGEKYWEATMLFVSFEARVSGAAQGKWKRDCNYFKVDEKGKTIAFFGDGSASQNRFGGGHAVMTLEELISDMN
jgi:hypothetical protein